SVMHVWLKHPRYFRSAHRYLCLPLEERLARDELLHRLVLMAHTEEFRLVVVVDHRTWIVGWMRNIPIAGQAPARDWSYQWIVSDGARQAVVGGAPTWDGDHDERRWAEILAPFVMRTVEGRGW